MDKEEIAKRFERTKKVRQAIITHCEDKRSVRGSIPCPIDGCGGEVGYSRASNGHIHARCSGSDCVCWME